MTTKIINGVSYDVYTMQQWTKDRVLSVKVGQLIEPSVYYQLLNAVPPIRMGAIFQVGEPRTHEFKTGKPLYDTFERVESFADWFKYVGTQGTDYGCK